MSLGDAHLGADLKSDVDRVAIEVGVARDVRVDDEDDEDVAVEECGDELHLHACLPSSWSA